MWAVSNSNVAAAANPGLECALTMSYTFISLYPIAAYFGTVWVWKTAESSQHHGVERVSVLAPVLQTADLAYCDLFLLRPYCGARSEAESNAGVDCQISSRWLLGIGGRSHSCIRLQSWKRERRPHRDWSESRWSFGSRCNSRFQTSTLWKGHGRLLPTQHTRDSC